jgi:hypothetical protein
MSSHDSWHKKTLQETYDRMNNEGKGSSGCFISLVAILLVIIAFAFHPAAGIIVAIFLIYVFFRRD